MASCPKNLVRLASGSSINDISLVGRNHALVLTRCTDFKGQAIKRIGAYRQTFCRSIKATSVTCSHRGPPTKASARFSIPD